MRLRHHHAGLLFALAFPAALSAATVRGKVLDPVGAPLNAFVFVYDNGSPPMKNGPPPGVTTVADSEGRFTVDLAPGFYDVCTFATGFTASCRKVRLKTRDDVVPEIFKMKFDPSSIGKEFE